MSLFISCKRVFPVIVFLLSSMLLSNMAWSQSGKERSVEVSVTTQLNPPMFDFSWPADSTANGYKVYKKSLEATDWGDPIATLPGDAASFSDDDIEVGVGYEYGFFKKEFDLVIDTVCVTPGTELRFKISDMYGIGLCCNFGFGYYKVEACGQTFAYGDNFGTEEITIFDLCDNGGTCEEVVITLSPDMFPNSTSWTLKNYQTNEVLATSGAVGSFIDERPKYGFIYAGIQLPAQEDRGTILLMIDDEYLTPLADELNRLEMDLFLDGYKVARRSANKDDAVTAVRSSIQEVYNSGVNLKAVYLIGHIPVPYSGDMYPDTHSENHWGAWSADSYYGEMNGNWTDTSVDNTLGFFERNHNVPGDGKFDQDSIPTELELQVGRVDFFDMDAFALSEIELTRRYLDKSHAFRNAQIEVQRRALVDDNFGNQFAAPSASAWRSFAPMFGAAGTEELDYFTTMTNETYLWSYGCGSGSHISSSGIGTTDDFASDSLLTVFTMLFGSQFGDWDNPNNFLRAPLAQGLTLTNVWAGNPPWTFHHMAMGYPIGYSAIRTLNSNNAVYLNGPQLVHANLLGDPSLRLHPVKAIENLVLISDGVQVDLTWNAPVDEDVAGYYVYRSDTLFGDYQRITSDIITDPQFVDVNPPVGENLYMVKTVKLENSGSGNYYNLSLGVIDSVDFVLTNELVLQKPVTFSVAPNPAKDFLNVNFTENINTDFSLTVLDKLGRNLLVEKYNSAVVGTSVQLNVNQLQPGVYFIQLESNGGKALRKVVVMD